MTSHDLIFRSGDALQRHTVCKLHKQMKTYKNFELDTTVIAWYNNQENIHANTYFSEGRRELPLEKENTGGRKVLKL